MLIDIEITKTNVKNIILTQSKWGSESGLEAVAFSAVADNWICRLDHASEWISSRSWVFLVLLVGMDI